MDLIEKYLIESKKFKSSYKEGDEIKVNAERRPVYAHHGYVEAGKISKKTLIVTGKASGNNSYTVEIKGTKVKWAGGVTLLTQGRLSIIDYESGILTTQTPAGKWEVTPI